MKTKTKISLFFILLLGIGGILWLDPGHRGTEETTDTTNFDLTKTYDIQESNDISIGQFIIGGPDIDDYMEKIGRPPPIVFYFSNWVLDDDFFKDPENPAPLSLIDIETLNKISDQGSIPAIAWETPVKFLNVTPDLFHLVPNVPRILNGEFDDYIATTAHIERIR